MLATDNVQAADGAAGSGANGVTGVIGGTEFAT